MPDAFVTVVCNQKGGVGKTTLTVQLAAAHARALPPIVPSDVDLTALPEDFGARAKILDQCVAQVLAVTTDPQPSLVEWLDNVHAAFVRAGKPMPIDYAQEHHRPQVLAKLKTVAQYKGGIFVDSPGWLPEKDDDRSGIPVEARQILAATLRAADLAIVPIEPEDLAFKPTKRTIEQVIEPSGVPFLVVINNWDPRDGTGDRDDTIARIQKQGWPLATTVMRRYKIHTTASAAGRTINEFPRNRVAAEAREDFIMLGLEIAKTQRGA